MSKKQKYAVLFPNKPARIAKFDSPVGYSFSEAKQELVQYHQQHIDRIINMKEDEVEE